MDEEASIAQKVKRINTAYVPAQDRFRMTAEMEDGEVHAMWLTQRLLRLALAPIADFFGSTPGPSDEQKARRSYHELMHKVRGKAGPPISTLTVGTEWLVEKIDMNFARPMRMTFRGPEGRAVVMEMDGLKLRKWLGILHKKSLKAGWPDALWPARVLEELE